MISNKLIWVLVVGAAWAGCGDDTGGNGGGAGTGGSTSSSTSTDATTSSSSSSSSSSTSATSTSSGGTCEFDDTAGLPCDVFRVLTNNCHFCHTDPQENGAPFPLLTYENTQFVYFDRPVWDRMQDAIEPGAIPGMPFGDNPPGLPEEDLDVLRAWFATCDAGECARAE